MNSKGILYLLAGIVLFAAIIMGASTLYGGLTGNIKSESEKQLLKSLRRKKQNQTKQTPQTAKQKITARTKQTSHLHRILLSIQQTAPL